jgi:hypothetical protein
MDYRIDAIRKLEQLRQRSPASESSAALEQLVQQTIQ